VQAARRRQDRADAQARESGAVSSLLREAPLTAQEAVLRELVEDVKARKKLLDDIDKCVAEPVGWDDLKKVERPKKGPAMPVAKYLKLLRGKKGRLSRDLKLLLRSEAGPAAIARVRKEIEEIQAGSEQRPSAGLDFWKQSPKSPYWGSEKQFLFALHGLAWKAGPGNRNYLFEHIKERGKAAVAKLLGMGIAAELARRTVARRLTREKLAPPRFSYRSLRPAAKIKRATI
jgi:hypothetical protein